MNIPGSLVAGDATAWNDDPFVGPNNMSVISANFALSYSFRGAGTPLDVTGTANGPGWTVSLTGTQTAAFNTGSGPVTWFWQAYATGGGSRYSAGSGTLLVYPNLQASSSTTFDGRTREEIDLAAIQAEISARISGGATLEYTIGNRHLKKESITVLLALESRYKSIVARQRQVQAIANGMGNPGKSFVRFK